MRQCHGCGAVAPAEHQVGVHADPADGMPCGPVVEVASGCCERCDREVPADELARVATPALSDGRYCEECRGGAA